MVPDGAMLRPSFSCYIAHTEQCAILPINPLSQNNEDLMKANVVALVKEEENREGQSSRKEDFLLDDRLRGNRT